MKMKPPREILTCTRCYYVWVARLINGTVRRPRVCPGCRSPYWDRPRERTKKDESKKS